MDKHSTLDSVVRQLQLEMGWTDDRRYYLLLTYAYAFLNGEYPANAAGGNTLKTEWIDIGPDRVATLPDDYVQLVSLGRVCGNKVRNLAYNANIVPAELLTEAQQQGAGYGDFSCAVQQDWPSYGYYGYDLLGITGWDGNGYGWGEWGGEFSLDPVTRTISLSSLIGGREDGPLLIQYQSNDVCPGKPTPIHPYWQQTLKAWMLTQYYRLAKENLQMAREHEAIYRKQRMLSLKRTQPDDLYASWRKIAAENYNTLH